MGECVLSQLPDVLEVTKAARLVRKANTGNEKTCVESWGMGKPKQGMLNETGRMNTEELWLILVETQVTSYRAGLTSHSLTGMWQWRLGMFPSAVIEAGMQAPQPQLPNCALASFSGVLKHLERDIYKKQQLTLREKLSRRERWCSPQRQIKPAAHLPLSFLSAWWFGK